MPIVLDPDKNFVTVQLMFVEEKDDKHGNMRFHILDSRADFDAWKKKGYVTSDELKQEIPDDKPGAPKKNVDPNKVIQVLRTWWSRMTWKEQNQIYSKCVKQMTDAEGKIKAELDLLQFRDLKLKTCLKRWDAKDDKNNELPLNDWNIDHLDPSIARALIEAFEKVTEASEEDLKN